MFRDIALFLHSVFHATPLASGQRDYWDTTKEQEVDHVVSLLSETQDPERIEIRRILRELETRTLLDAGCGPGTELTGYKESAMRIDYTGIDGSQRMISLARQRHPSASFIRGSLSELPFNDKSFDVVLLKHILEHQTDYQPLVKEAVRVSRKAVIINHFHRLLPFSFHVMLKDRRGFHNNWYSRSKFEKFCFSLPVARCDHLLSTGTARQTAEIYVLHRSNETAMKPKTSR